MKSRQGQWKWVLLVVVGLILVPTIVLGLGVLWVTPVRVERSTAPSQEEAIPAPAEETAAALSPASTLDSLPISLDPQNSVHLFVFLPLIGALIVLPLGGAYGLVWRKWLRSQDDRSRPYENGEESARGSRPRYVLFVLLSWVALSLLFIFDLLGAASLYPLFVLVYAAFWALIGTLLLYDRPLSEKLVILVVFLVLIFSLRFVDWNSRKPFLRDFYRVEEGMASRQVEKVMGGYGQFVPAGAELDGQGYLIAGTVSYTHTDQAWGDSDIGLVTFKNGRVVETTFLPD